MANVIREDVIKISFDIGEELKKLNDSVDEFKKKISGGVGGDAFDDFKKSVNGTDSEIDGLKKSISGLGKSTESYGSTATKVGQNIKKAFSSAESTIKTLSTQVDSAADKIQSKIFNVKNLIAGIATGLVVQQSIDVVVDRQNITSQFEVLLGSAEAAQKRVQELTDFASLTPFTRDEIFAASKQLQVFTGDALSTGDSLRIIGDVAAGTGQEFEEVALWTGRLYDAMKSGRPVGEMTARLQEMGAISGEDRSKIEALAAAGGDISERWAEVETIFGRYNGTMEKLSNNLGNMLTSLKSFATNSIFLPIGEGIAQGLQPAIQKFREFRKTNKDDVEAMGTVFKNFAEKLCIPLFTKLESGVEGLIEIIGALKDGVSGLEKFKGKSAFLDGIIEAIKFVNDNKETFISGLQGIGIALGGIVIASKINKLATAFKFLASPLGIVSAIAVGLFMKFKADGGTIPELISKIGETLKKANPILEVAKSMFSWLGDSLEFLGKHIKVILPLVISLVATFKGLSLIKSITGFFSKTKGESSGGFFSGIVSTFKELAKVNTKTILKGIANMTIILGSFTILIGIFMAIAPKLSALSDLKTVTKMLFAITALGLVGMALTKFAQITGKVPIMTVVKGIANMTIILGSFTILTGIFMAIAPRLSALPDIKAITKMLLVITALGLVGTALSKFSQIAGKVPIMTVVKGLANMAIMLAGMSALYMVIGAVSLINFDIKEMLKISAMILVLGTIGTVLSIFAGIVGLIPIPIVLSGLANIALVVAGMALLFMAIGAVSLLGFDTKEILKISAVMLALGTVGTVLSIFAGIVGLIPIPIVLSGLANIALAVAGMSALFMAIDAVSLLDFDIKKILKISAVMLALGTVGTVLSIFAGIVGLIPIPVVLTGLANIALVIGGLTALIIAFGALSEIPHFNEFITSGGETLANLFGQLGKICGSLIGGFGAGIADSLPSLGANLSAFATALQPMFTAFEGANLTGVSDFFKSFGEFMLSMAANDILSFITGGTDLSTIGIELTTFADGVSGFFDKVATFPAEGFTNAKLLFQSLSDIGNVPKTGGLVQWFSGDFDFIGLANGLQQLSSERVIRFYNTVSQIPAEAFESAKALFQSLSDIGNIPKTGGISQWFSGETDFTVLSTQLPAFGEAMKSFYTSISGIEDFGKIKELFKALEGIEEMMPKEGGVFNKIGEAFGGEVSLETLGASLKQFGEDAAGFFTQINGLDIEKLNSLWSSLKGFDGISDSLTTSLSSMAEPLGSVATEFSNLCVSIGTTVIQASLLQGLLSSVLSFTRSISSEFAKAAESPALLSVALGVLETDAAAKMARLVTVMRAAMKSINAIMEDSASEINNTMATCINDLVDKISQLPQKMGDGLRNSGSYLSSALTEIWQDAVIASAGPVNKVIEGANWILEQFGSSDSIASWTPYAKGTDGHRGGNALVNDGRGAELVQMPNGRSFIPQGRNVFIPNAPKGMKVLPAEQTAQLMGKKSPTFKYAEGTGDIDIFSFMDNASGLIDKVTEKYVSYDGLSGLALKIGKGMVTTITKRMVDWADKLFDQLGAISLANYSPSAGVEQWRSLVIQALKMEGVYSPENVERTLFQMQTESGGNPMAINLWDSNAAAGIPSKGLMQCIDPTFRAYARPGFDTNIYDPLSNILASIRYALARYGSLANAYRGVGYANGGLVTKPGFIGEEGQEMVIPLNRDKRKRAVGLWQETGSALGVYTPENSSGYSGNSTVEENNTYAPTFNITVNGSMTDRATVNETKRQFYEMLNEYFESLERKNRLIRQT